MCCCRVRPTIQLEGIRGTQDFMTATPLIGFPDPQDAAIGSTPMAIMPMCKP